MRSSQWPGPHLATSLPPAAAIRVCGSGKVSPGPSRSSWVFRTEFRATSAAVTLMGSSHGLLSFFLPQLMRKMSTNVSVSSTPIRRMLSMWSGTRARR